MDMLTNDNDWNDERDYDVNNGDGSDDDTLAKRRDRGPRSMPNKDVQMANNHNGEIIYYVQPASTLAMMVMMSFSRALQSYKSWKP